MKKIWNKILAFWFFKVKNRTQKKAEVGPFEFEFRDYDMTIKTASENFLMRIRADVHAFGYLAASESQGKEDNLHGYATILYILATCMTKDQRLTGDVTRAIERYDKRVAALAYKVKSEDEVGEKIALEQVKKETERSTMGRRERRKAEKEVRKAAKEAYGEDGDSGIA